jgi:hypothetical protein
VHASHGDTVLQAHQLGQHLGALDDGQVPGARLQHLGIVGADRGGGDHHLCSQHVLGVVAVEDRGPQGGQALGHGGMLEVGTRDLVAEREQHLGDTAHADATDAHKVHALDLGEQETVSSF